MSDIPTVLDSPAHSDSGAAENLAPAYATTDGEPYADDFSNLREDKIAELRSVCDAMDQRDEWARFLQIIRCTLRRYFNIGIQHPTWNSDAGTFQVGPAGATLGEEDEDAEQFFEGEFNIFTSYGKVFMAVFSQNPAPARMEPDKPRQGDSVKAAREAEKYAEVYQKYNPPKSAQMEVARLMYTDGQILAVTEYEADEENCGVDEDGNPQGAEFTKYYGVLESKYPIIGKFKSWPYCKVSRELDTVVAQDENSRIADQIEAGAKGQTPNNEIARMSRIAVGEGIAQVSSDTLAYLVTEDRYWLRPSAFRHLAKDKQAFWIGGTKQREDGTKEKITGICEQGFRARWIGTIFAAGSDKYTMDKQCRMMHALPGDDNARPSISDAMVPVQMEFNDAMGMYSQMIHKCIPRTFLNINDESMAAIVESFSRWGEYSAMQPQNGGNLNENIFQEAHFDVPASYPQWVQNLQGPLAQQILNIQPAMFGGNMDDQKTAKAYQQAKDMSLGVMAIVWVPYLEFHSGIVWQAARLAGARDETKISAVLPLKDGKSKTIDIDTSVLKRGGFLCSAVSDTSFPESPADKSNKWIGIYQAAEQNPQGISAQILAQPDNAVGLKDAIGLDLVMPGAQARDRQLAEWDLMQPQKGGDGPIPDEAAAQAQDKAKQQQAQQVVNTVAPGQQAPPIPPTAEIHKSSVPIRVGDDDIEHARTCRRILESDEVWDLINSAAPQLEVVEDLVLHMQAHLLRAQKSGLVIPPDLAGIIPPPPPPPPTAGALPGAPPSAPNPHPHPAAGAVPPPGAQPLGAAHA